MKASGDDESVLARAQQLDELDGILPFARRNRLAALLTDEDVDVLVRLSGGGRSDNSIRALATDLAHLEAWSIATTGTTLPWPAPEALVLRFIQDHLGHLSDKDAALAQGTVAPTLTRSDPFARAEPRVAYAPSTVKRRIASWSVLTFERGLQGNFFANATIRSAMRTFRAALGTPQKTKSRNPVDGDVLEILLSTCSGDTALDIRDRALLLTAFASGGRRRAELAGMQIDEMSAKAERRTSQKDDALPALPQLVLRAGAESSTKAAVKTIVMTGPPVAALNDWLSIAGITSGPIFRRVDQWGNIGRRALSPQAVNLILKTRCKKAGLDPNGFSADGLRTGARTGGEKP